MPDLVVFDHDRVLLIPALQSSSPSLLSRIVDGCIARMLSGYDWLVRRAADRLIDSAG